MSLYRRCFLLLSGAAAAAALLFALVGGAVAGRACAEASAFALGRSAGALAALAPEGRDPGQASAFCAAAAEGSGFRITLVLPDGSVAADSEADPASMGNHGDRPELREALAGRVGTARRRSATLGSELAYAAAPVLRGGRAAAALRIAALVPTIDAQVAKARWAIAASALLLAALAAAAAAAFSRSLALPLAGLASRARAYASGELPAAARRAAPRGGPAELATLELALEAMASQLDERIRGAEAQGEELEAVLHSMTEAVLALDGELRVRLVNPAALALFGLGSAAEALGRGLLEAARSTELEALARSCAGAGASRRAELVLGPAGRWFRALASPYGSSGGLVLALEDETELKRLERVRRDFVANVSHELRTPVQVIKGFAESLLEQVGSFPEGGDPEARPTALRHLAIVARNASRMESLIGDLLSLAQLEREGARIEVEEVEVGRLLEEAAEAVAPKAEAKGARIGLTCPEGLRACVNPGLVVQALVNLLDNAVKYSPPGGPIALSASRDDAGIRIEVRDQGLGIPAKDLGRLFERFYRVDKARSRELGGTGLGLAIVKHIALAHGGSASVESWEGEGSAFRILLPQGEPRAPGS